MPILNIEDDVIKHSKIARVLEDCRVQEADWAKNLEEAVHLTEEAAVRGIPYDLVITDMYYPLTQGGEETEAGLQFIERMREKEPDLPIVLCSSVRYRMPEIFGTVYYSEHADWECELHKLLESLPGKKG